MSRFSAGCVAALSLTLCAAASAQTRFAVDNLGYTTTAPVVVGPITFSETQFPLGSVIDGLTVSALNATPLPAPLAFGFTLYGSPSTDSVIYDFTGIPFSSVSGYAIEGTAAGILAIDFGTNVTSVSFDFALDGPLGETVANACTVTAYTAAGAVAGSDSAAGEAPAFFPENQVTFASATPFRRITLDFETQLAEEIPALGGWGLAALIALVGLAGATVVRRVSA